MFTSIVGAIVAEDEVRFPNAFGQWLLEGGYGLSSEDSLTSDGVPLKALYALRMAADSRGLPWSIQWEDGVPVVVLRLPEEGLRRGLVVEACEDLRMGSWIELESGDFMNSDSSLDAGATGERRILVSGTRMFRIKASVSE